MTQELKLIGHQNIFNLEDNIIISVISIVVEYEIPVSNLPPPHPMTEKG